MEEEQSNHGGEDGDSDCLFHFTIPLVRYTTRLIAGGNHHRYILRDYAEPQSEEGGDEFGSMGEIFAYSSPIVVLDLIWNLAFVLFSLVVLLSTFREKPSTPLRVWVCGCALQSILHVGFVFLDYQGRNEVDHRDEDQLPAPQSPSSILKRLESLNIMISFVWWVFGFYWIVVGGQALLQDSPRLYWLTVVFLAFDVFYIIFCIGMAFIICIAILCCIPIVAIAYAVRIREGASEDDINALPKYRFHRANSSRIFDHDKKHRVLGTITEPGCCKSAKELALPLEDSECCICLSRYVDGAELYTLPCNHHFHCRCISRWLQINATCPLCKFNILRGDTLV